MTVLEILLSPMAPHECLVCAEEGSLFCERCRYETLEPVPDRCYRCLAKSKQSTVCAKCRNATALKHVWVSCEYENIQKELVRLFKYERARAAYGPIAEQVAETLPYIKPETIITYIPTATTRQRIRGYDQAKLMAKRLAKLKGATFMPLLERHGQTRQVGSTKKQRHEQATKMFRFTGKDIAGATIIIVDDILTTGASLEAAARLLKQNDAKSVSAAVFAQKH